MLNQTFSPNSFRKLMTKLDPRNYEMGTGVSDYKIFLTNLSYKVSDPSYHFSSFNCFRRGKNKFYSVACPEDDFALRKVTDTLRRIYRVKYPSRDLLVKSIHTILQENMPLYIYKFDVKSFYENIDKKLIVSEINNNQIVSFDTKRVFNQFFNSSSIEKNTGVPRGFGLSACLSEIYMREFDNKINSISGVYFYCRYVDDIFIVSYQELKGIEDVVISNLPKGLELNTNKSLSFDVSSASLKKPVYIDYLGYEFFVNGKKSQNEFRIVNISISKRKIKKIKTRLIKSIIDYSRNLDAELLSNRIKYLTGNFYLKKKNLNSEMEKESGGLRSGIYYNYRHSNNSIQLKELDLFLRKLLMSSNGSIYKFVGNIPKGIRRNIIRYSFSSGFESRRTYDFTEKELKDINRCWKND